LFGESHDAVELTSKRFSELAILNEVIARFDYSNDTTSVFLITF